jgi:hypothetical protein
MSKKLWIDNPNDTNVIKTKMHIDESENKYHFEDVQDVQPILERNKLKRRMTCIKLEECKMQKCIK